MRTVEPLNTVKPLNTAARGVLEEKHRLRYSGSFKLSLLGPEDFNYSIFYIFLFYL